MFVKVDGMMLLHLPGLLNLDAALLGGLLQHVEVLLDLKAGTWQGGQSSFKSAPPATNYRSISDQPSACCLKCGSTTLLFFAMQLL